MVVHPAGCDPEPASPRPKLEVADIFGAHAADYLKAHPVSVDQRKVIEAILACRTAALGGHLDVCDACGYAQVSYNSCRNRHCPKCQGLAQADWLNQRKERILPVPHFHVVFTLPAELRPLARLNPAPLYDLLFQAAARTLISFGCDPKHLGAQIGITAVLHTWSRDLLYHPHVHCIVTGGGLSGDGTRWVHKDDRFLFPVRPMAQVFRGKFLKGLSDLLSRGALVLGGDCAQLSEAPAWEVLLNELWNKSWVVYAKRPFGGAERVYSYLGRYTHRVGLSNRRLLWIGPDQVCFKTKLGQTCTVSPMEFIRRFLLHVLPPGLVKIRHFGLLSATGVRTRLPLAQRLLAPAPSAVAPVSASTAPPTPAPVPTSAAVPTSASPAAAAAPWPPVPSTAAPPWVPAPSAPLTVSWPAEADYRDKLKALTGIDLRVCPRCHKGRMLRCLQVGPSASTRSRSWGRPVPAAPRGDAAFADSS